MALYYFALRVRRCTTCLRDTLHQVARDNKTGELVYICIHDDTEHREQPLKEGAYVTKT